KVVKCLGEADRQGVQILRRPRTLIETAYNHLARNTIVQQIGLALTDWAASADPLLAVQSREGLSQIATRISPFLFRSNVFGKLWMFLYVPSGSHYVSVGSSDALEVQPAEHDGVIQLRFQNGQAFSLEPTAIKRLYSDDRHIVATLEVDDLHYGALVLEARHTKSSLADEDRTMVADVASKIEQTLSNIASHLLRSEKQKADISVALSTSMGHDLTNMIATSKWDIRTVQMYLDRVLPKLGDDRQAKIFGQSLQGLLNNMQLLQEVVDLYRSLGLTKRPQYELTNMNHLVDDAVNLFQFSTSRNVVLTTEHEKGLAEVAVEPRLLKVALFNLLSNAGQACAKRSIQIGQSEEKYFGEIHVQTLTAKDNHIAIEIRDNGTGFLDKEGRRLPGDQIHRTFRSGYTTKTGRVAGGLGLS
ncbi:MAG TPA: HAMP domain-containing sensor histidine kinase, partial [bacterium]|nr:HAMP domain-containing sensor histidine kinase [bacterium]